MDRLKIKRHLFTGLLLATIALIGGLSAYYRTQSQIAYAATTRYITDDATGGDCTLKGTWNAGTKTCTLTDSFSVGDNILMNSDNITLDCDNFMIKGAGGGNGVNISSKTGVTVQNCDISIFSRGISVASSTNIDLLNNTISDITQRGIYDYLGDDIVIADNVFVDSAYGIYAYQSNNILAERNTISTPGIVGNYGIALYPATNSTVNNNNITGNGIGILVRNNVQGVNSGNEVTNNTLDSISDSNDTGINITFSGYVVVSGNTVNNSTIAGIKLSASDYCTVQNNPSVDGNGTGIQVTNSNNNSVISNSVDSSSGNGLYLSNAYDNTITSNTITLSGGYGVYLSSATNNTLNGNTVTGSTTVDIRDTDANPGTNNTCATTDNWNDLGYIGCQFGGSVDANCGDGTIDGGEACDDGNVVSDDGCVTCRIEYQYQCFDEPSFCHVAPFCGDVLYSSVTLDHDLICTGGSPALNFYGNDNTVVLDCNGHSISSDATSTISITRNNKTIKNCNITPGGSNAYYGIYSSSSADNVTLENNTITGMRFNGILLSGSTDSIITGNTTNDNGQASAYFSANSNGVGINLNQCNGTTITGNTTDNNTKNGILLDSTSTDNTLKLNQITNNDIIGLHLRSSAANNTVGIDTEGNTVTGNLVGIRIESTGNTIEDNTVNSNTDVGMQFNTLSTSNTARNNTVTLNKHGIEVNTNSHTLTGNIIDNNTFDGLRLYGDNNTVIQNQIMNNGSNDIRNDGVDNTGNLNTCETLLVPLSWVDDTIYELTSDICSFITLDYDSDTINNVSDNCPIHSNVGQDDDDGDGIGNVCDNCWDISNPDQLDSNSNCAAGPFAEDPECGFLCELPSTPMTWTQQTTTSTSTTFPAVYFVDENTGWIASRNGEILSTTNGGSTWTSEIIGTAIYSGLYFTDENTGWAVGTGGTIIKYDTGVWTSQTSGTANILRDVFFIDDATCLADVSQCEGWAVGDNATIRYTADGGLNWSSQTAGGLPSDRHIWSVYFADANNGWATPQNISGNLLKTTNGTSWSLQQTGLPRDYYDIQFIDVNTGWAVGQIGEILKTTDAGVTWTALTSGTTEHINGVYFVDANKGWAVGQGGTILRTINGGSTWSEQIIGNRPFQNVYFVDENTGWAVGESGTIYKGKIVVSGGSSRPPVCNQTSTQITNLNANLVQVEGDTAIQLTWDASNTDSSEKFLVHRSSDGSTNPDNMSTVKTYYDTTSSENTIYVDQFDNDVYYGKTYTYVVQARNNCSGNTSDSVDIYLPVTPDTVNLNLTLKIKVKDVRETLLLERIKQVLLDQQNPDIALTDSTELALISKLEERSLLSSLDPNTLTSYDQIVNNQELKEAILEIPEIETLIRGHSANLTLKIWEPGNRVISIVTEAVATNIFGEAALSHSTAESLKNFVTGTYDFTVKHPDALRQSMNSVAVLDSQVTVDFSSSSLKFGDFNNDSTIDLLDLQVLSSGINQNPDQFDINEDGEFDLADLMEVLSNWGE